MLGLDRSLKIRASRKICECSLECVVRDNDLGWFGH